MRLLVSTIAFFLALGPPAVRADDCYYIAVLAAESKPYRPKQTHSFAVAVHGCDVHTISWLPQTLKLRLFRLPEPGLNLDLHATIAWVQDNGMCLSIWGPYQVSADMYRRFLRTKAALDDGYQYAVPCGAVLGTRDVDCAHALLMFTDDPHCYVGPFGFGEPAAARVVAELGPHLVGPPCTRFDIAFCLGLAPYDLLWRDFHYRPTRCDALQRSLER